MSRPHAAGILCAISLAGCGARAHVDSGEGAELGAAGEGRQPPGAPEGPPPGFEPGATPPSRPGDPAHFDPVPLGDCEPGYEEPDGQGSPAECRFKFNGLCYEDWDAVCACACPRVERTHCVAAGFFEPGPLEVTCYAQ